MDNNETNKVSYEPLKTTYIAKMLTTEDNPYDPFDEFDDWYKYDTEVLNYNTCALISRLIDQEFGLRGFDLSTNNEQINSIIDKIVKLDPLNQYIVVTKKITTNYLNK